MPIETSLALSRLVSYVPLKMWHLGALWSQVDCVPLVGLCLSTQYRKGKFTMGHVTLVAITGITILVPYLKVKSLQLIWRSGTCLNIKTVFTGIGISIIKIRWSWDRLIFIMGTPILVRWCLYIETCPRYLQRNLFFICGWLIFWRVVETRLLDNVPRL